MFETTVDCRLFDTKMAADFEDIKIEKVKTEQLFLKLEREKLLNESYGSTSNSFL